MSEELFARLARLRREERASPPLARPSAAALPEWLTHRLAARAHVRTRARSPGLPPEHLQETRGERGTFAVRRAEVPASHAHGDWRLDEIAGAASAELALLARDQRLLGLDLARAVYLDIETTGLSGGAGTVPFLVALGTFEPAGAPGDEGRFVLWQGFLRGPEEEAALLEVVAEKIQDACLIVSFFGKSFDRHRLEDKMRAHRIAPPFPAGPPERPPESSAGTGEPDGAGRTHLDLYYPLARLYRGAYADARLATLERELCGVEREDDLPGCFAPAAWFDYLAGRPHRLEGVFRHNALDVLSLVVLAAHLARSRAESRADGRRLEGCGRARARGIAEIHARRGEHADALLWLEHALTRSGSDEGELWFRHAELLRKCGERERALEEFTRLAREHNGALAARAWVEVAKLARRAKQAALVDEARERGPAAIERALTGRQRARALAVFERPSARRLSCS